MEQLLSTKVSLPPARSDLVSRPRLIERLNEGLDCKLTLISAPAGYGKTSLAVEWLRKHPVPHSWLALEDDDNDPSRFLTYLLAALEQAIPGIGAGVWPLLSSPQRPPSEALLTVLINELKVLEAPLLLVLDDFHLIHSKQIHDQITFLLEHQPEQLHQIILTREDPLLPLHRFRARRSMLEIRQDDLRFSPEEAAVLFDKQIGIDLSKGDVEAITQRTEGWAAGLQLAALSLREITDVHHFIESFTGSNRYVLDYLFEEVFRAQPEEVQSFLLHTSVLNRLTASLCDALTGRGDGHDQLRALDRANLFLIPLDSSRNWYRYQHLFADLLRHLLHLSSDLSEADLHKNASHWYWEHGFQREAVRHALASQDWELVAQLIPSSSGGMLMRGEIATLLDWFAKTPTELIETRVELCLAYGWALALSGQVTAAGDVLRRAEELAGEYQAVLGEIAAAKAFLAQSLGDVAQLIEQSHRALALLPDDNLVQRGTVALSLGMAYWHLGRLDEGQKALEEALQACQGAGYIYGETSARLFLARSLAVRGQLCQALAEFEEIATIAEEKPVVPLVYLDLLSVHYEWNNLEDAFRYLELYKTSSQQMGNLEFQVIAHTSQARLEHALGNPTAADRSLEQAGMLVQSADIPPRTKARYYDLKVQLALLSGDLDDAQRTSAHLLPGVDYHTYYRFLGLTPSRILLATGHRQQAAEKLSAAAKTAKENGWLYGLIAARTLQALVAEDTAEAIEYLVEALTLAQPQGFIRVFADAGEPLIPLLKDSARQGYFPDYVGRILKAMKSASQFGQAQDALVEPLSQREVEVLRLVVAGLSNREIASMLVLSLGTVKTHIHNIYGKLGVSNRAQAIRRATDLQLL